MPDTADLEAAVDILVEKSPRLSRPLTSFFFLIFGSVVLFAGRGPLLNLWASQRPSPRLSVSIPLRRLVSPPPPSATTPPPPPPPLNTAKPLPAAGPAARPPKRTVDAHGAADPGGAPRVGERSPLIQGMVESGFSREQAEAALTAINAKDEKDIPKAIEWQLKRDVEANRKEAAGERENVLFDKMDFDGYALMWGSEHRKKSIAECAEACRTWKPKPPAFYACNVFVFCGLEKCYAPAALPPGSMQGQCWLKHQPDPMHPQVNMKGDYSEAYIKRHPGAPPAVQWQAGVVVKKGAVQQVETATWSSRANW